MPIPKIIIYLCGGYASIEAANGPVDVAIVDFDVDGALPGDNFPKINMEPAAVDIFEVRPSDTDNFDRLWAEVEAASRYQ